MQHPRLARLFGLLILSPAVACSDYTSAPNPPEGVGSYAATTFTTTANGVTQDQLALGVTLTLTLAADGTTAGSLLVPAASDTPVDLAGTWSRAGTVVTFHHATPTFIDVLPFDLQGRTLVAAGTVGTNVIRVTLSR
jgi:hypothetical protein